MHHKIRWLQLLVGDHSAAEAEPHYHNPAATAFPLRDTTGVDDLQASDAQINSSNNMAYSSHPLHVVLGGLRQYLARCDGFR